MQRPSTGYAAPRFVRGDTGSGGGNPSLLSSSGQQSLPSPYSMALTSLSNSLPNFASLQSALRGSGGHHQHQLTQPDLQRKSYYSRRIGSAQHGSRMANSSSSLVRSNNYYQQGLLATSGLLSSGGRVQLAQLSASNSTGSLSSSFQRSGFEGNVGLGSGAMTSSSSTSKLLASSSTPSPAAQQLPTPAIPVPSLGPSISPIQTKKKSVRWSESLVSFDSKGRVGAAGGVDGNRPQFSHQQHGHEVLVLKSSLTAGTSSNNVDSASSSSAA